MIFKKLFSVYSPIWQLIFALTSISGFASIINAYVLQNPEASLVKYNNSTMTYAGELQLNNAFFIPLLLIIISIVAYVIACYKHNKKEGTHKVNPFSLRPNEVIGNDERVRQASANAALKLYIRNHFNLPLLALVLISFSGAASVHLTAVVFMIFITGYYLTYLHAMWPYLGED